MDLSIREAATLLKRSRRTVRAQVARGEVPGKKVNGRWRIRRRDLPLTEAQRVVLQAKAERVRRAVEAALPSRLAASSGNRQRRLADLDVFVHASRLLAEIRSRESERQRARVERLLEEALLAVADGTHQYDRRLKLDAFNRARRALARALALLLIDSGVPPPEPVFGWVRTLERVIIPSLAGLARWADGLGKRR